jgi:hypothetical protein
LKDNNSFSSYYGTAFDVPGLSMPMDAKPVQVERIKCPYAGLGATDSAEIPKCQCDARIQLIEEVLEKIDNGFDSRELLPIDELPCLIFGCQRLGKKRCTRCGRVKPLDRFRRDKQAPGGHSTRCKRCKKETEKEKKDAEREEKKRRLSRIRENLRLRGVRQKTCLRCSRSLPLTAFGANNHCLDGLENLCVSCTKEETKVKKICSKCLNLIPLSAFRKDKRRPDGRSTICLACHRKREKNRRALLTNKGGKKSGDQKN